VAGCTFNYIKTTNGVDPATPTNVSPVMASGQLQINDTSAKVKVVASKDGWVTSDATATQTYTINMVLSVTVSPATAIYVAGGSFSPAHFTSPATGTSQQYTATVSTIGNPSYTVAWSRSGNSVVSGPSTSFSLSTPGWLDLGNKENGATITIKATVTPTVGAAVEGTATITRQ
jgi:hypothetical protein